ncbi:MAG: hypothetical protein GXP08_06570 [Gammaproteobacteria bacterium]|nr:hypothetical protein [Gammaproteobacteria bacterium]
MMKKTQNTNAITDANLTDRIKRQKALSTEIERLAQTSIAVKQKVYSTVEATHYWNKEWHNK